MAKSARNASSISTGAPDLRIAMIGLGLRGNLLDVAHRPGQGSVVVGLCDLDESLLDYRCRQLHRKPWTTKKAADVFAAADVDAVIIATPDHTHEELVIASLRAGKATFAEKPLAITTDGCDRILATAAEVAPNGVRLYVGHNLRHYPAIRTMKSLIDDGVIGEVQAVWCRHFVGHGGDFYFKDWHAQRRHVTSLLLQKGAHDIDALHWLAGGVSRMVQGIGKLAVYGRVTDRHDGNRHDNWFEPDTHWPPLAQVGLHPEIDIEDLSMMQMELSNGVLASYLECHFTPDYWRNYTVIGTEGRIENFGDVEGVVKLWNTRGGYDDDGNRQFAFSPGDGAHGGADATLMAEFVRFARVGGATETSPIGAREAVAAGCAAAQSLRSGGVPVRVAPPDPEVVRALSAQ
jgi:predicted dehydrogenase